MGVRRAAYRTTPWALGLCPFVPCFEFCALCFLCLAPPARRGYPREEGGGGELEAEAARIKHEKPRKIETERDTAK